MTVAIFLFRIEKKGSRGGEPLCYELEMNELLQFTFLDY